MASTTESQLLELNERLLESIAAKDWEAYIELCDPELTCFEPEARGHLVTGLGFHKYYFDLAPPTGARNSTLSVPRVRMLGADAAVISYVRLIQYLDAGGIAQTAQFEETRVWHRQNDNWKHVHFHRSSNS
jgi:hypothetical protein